MAKSPIKKKFFRNPSVAAIKRDKVPDRIDFDGDIASREMFLISLADAFWPKHLDAVPFGIDCGRYILTPSPFPEDCKYFAEPNKFLRNGSVIELLPSTERKYLARGIFPAQVLLRALNARSGAHGMIAGYRYAPIFGDDRRRRQMSLVDIIEGAKLFSHSEDQRLMLMRTPQEFYSDAALPGIKIADYGNTDLADKKGAKLIVHTPSTTTNQMRYPVGLSGLAISNLQLAYSLYADHSCKARQFKSLGYSRPDEFNRLYFCNHDIAAMLGVEDYYARVKNNIVPTRASMVPIPSQALVHAYSAMKQNWLIEYAVRKNDGSIEMKLRKPNHAELQVVLDAIVRKVAGIGASFTGSRYDSSGEHVLNGYTW